MAHNGSESHKKCINPRPSHNYCTIKSTIQLVPASYPPPPNRGKFFTELGQ